MTVSDVKVRPISIRRAAEVILTKHYALRLPPISYCFGAIIDKELVGVCTFAPPCTISMSIGKHPWEMIELNRLVVWNSRKNLSSILVSQCLHLLPRPMVVVSYADTNVGHVGYIYQASNWIYTGTSAVTEIYKVNGRALHAHTVVDRFGTRSVSKLKSMGHRVEVSKELPKHRYFYPLAKNRFQRKEMVQYIVQHFGQLSYPKGESKRYDVQQLIDSKPKTGLLV